MIPDRTRRLLRLLLISTVAIQPSCERRQDQKTRSPIPEAAYDYVLAVVFDMSGSFSHHMLGDHPIAYRFCLSATDAFFRDRMGENDQLVIAQISAAQEGLLWQGSPISLRRSFPDAEAFRQFLLDQADPTGSRVHDSLGQTLTYLMNLPGVTEDTQLLVVVVSDLQDTTPNSPKAERDLQQALAKYGRRDGAIGLYWVDQNLAPAWRDRLQRSGIRHYTVESEIVSDPALPTFD